MRANRIVAETVDPMSFVAFLLCVLVVASSGAVFRPGAWYRTLSKPSWTPPDWLFGPAWAVLYLMIAVAGWRVWEYGPADAVPVAMAVFALQLVLNALWSAVFFGLKRPDWAFLELVAMWASIAVNIAVFYPLDALAGWLLVPYLAWVTFAGALNLTIWRLNRRPA